MFISIFAVTLFILLAAMIMDFGLFYYKQARLQNAGDAAATAVAASIDATDKDLNAIAKQYLKKNGVDYSDDDMTINIQKKGMLDEATASLDVENETLIQAALSRLIKDKTVLVIAHRMRTVSGADKVVVLSNGFVAEQGTPEKLMNTGKIYPHMVKLQMISGDWGI